ncbi:hypothetical protein J7337_001775 [Fusarium musae]|uniref:Uncharacterized protein n=1 Tax=Fusarium musae TaxID=1042133 RepID=A0A9P8DUQ1_9HYPO|nr:hypothetical protein J7337_001775 [Fusarium musae]KAG9508212.1 hypothetical protein J7337_001775 [Fusarium musae]
MPPLYGDPTTTVHPKHRLWLCEKKANDTDGTKCNTHNDVNDLMCMKCGYEVDGWIKVKAKDKDEKEIGELHDYDDGVVRLWRMRLGTMRLYPEAQSPDSPQMEQPTDRLRMERKPMELSSTGIMEDVRIDSSTTSVHFGVGNQQI